MRLEFSGSGKRLPNPSKAMIEPRESLTLKIHLQRTQVYKYGCGRRGPGLSRVSIANWWRISSAMKAIFRLVRDAPSGVADDGTLPPMVFSCVV
jgi:hypothetical protein